MVVVVVVPEKEEALVEIPVPLEIALQHQPGTSVHGFAPIGSAFDGVDALRRFDRSSAKPHRLLPLFTKQPSEWISSTLKKSKRMSTSPGDGGGRWRRTERLKEQPIERRFTYLDVCLNLDDDLGFRQGEPDVVTGGFINGNTIADDGGSRCEPMLS